MGLRIVSDEDEYLAIEGGTLMGGVDDSVEIVLIKGKLEEVELPVKQVDIIVSEVSPTSNYVTLVQSTRGY